MKKRLSLDRKYLLVTGIIMQIILLLPWISLGGKRYNTYAYLFRLHASEDMQTVMRADFASIGEGWMDWTDIQSMMFVFIGQLLLLVVLQILGIISILQVFSNKKKGLVSGVCLVICAANLFSITSGPTFYMDSWFAKLYLLIMLILQGINLIGYRMIDSWVEATEEMRRIKEHERQVKKERKERLVFEGKYSALFYQVVWKNFKSNWATYRIFVLVDTVSISFIFAGMGMREMLSGMQGVENLLTGQGLGAILLNFLASAIIISIFLIVSVLMFYLKNHMSSYSLFQNLGIRSKTLYLFIGTELAVCMILALIGGCILGNVILFVCRIAIRNGFDGAILLENITVKSYLLTLLVSFLVYLISAMATHDVYYETGGTSARYKAVQKEKMPGILSPLFMIFGAGVIVFSVYGFFQREHAEGMVYIVFFLIGLYLFMRHCWNMYLRLRKKKNSIYLGSILKKNYFYHHFKTAYRYLFLFTILHICVLFVFSREVTTSLIEEEPEIMFPYDYVCMAIEDDMPIFEEIKNENQAEVLSYPMVRVSNADNSTDINGAMECIQPQGQHIGISESTYRKLCENIGEKPKQLNLAEDGSEIYVIYQEDKSVRAHPIDYYMGTKTPYLHIGQPLIAYDYVKREKLFQPRKVIGMERTSLIGNLRQGEHENIVVFSDGYFAEVEDMWKTTIYWNGEQISEEEAIEDVTIHHWPDQLVLINVADDQKQDVEEKLQIFEDNHLFDNSFDSEVQSWYSKTTLIDQIKSERFMNIAVSMFIMIIMAIVSLILLYMKVESEMDEKKRQQEFLECMGMRKRERLQIIKSELGFYFWVPMAISIISIIVFTAITWKLRLFSQTDCIAYSKVLTIIFLIYTAVELLGMKCLEYYIIRKVEGSHGNNH